MTGLKIGSLFSGTGGLDLAVEAVTGATPAWFCEWDDAPSKILAHHWPEVPNYRDVTKIDWETLPPVDIITGGYPCQPFSRAGLRKGTKDERHLWPYVRQAIRILRPRFALLENVAGHRSMGFSQVLADCAEDGLHVRWTSVRASDVGGGHHRERLFIVVSSDPDSLRLEEGRLPGGQEEEITGYHGGVGSFPAHNSEVEWGDYTPVIRRWEKVTRKAPDPVVRNDAGKFLLSIDFLEWFMGLPSGHVSGVEGVSRADKIKMLGNGVCPQQAIAALEILLTMREKMLT